MDLLQITLGMDDDERGNAFARRISRICRVTNYSVWVFKFHESGRLKLFFYLLWPILCSMSSFALLFSSRKRIKVG